MNTTTDIAIIGAGPVGLMCAYLAHLSGLNAIIVDKNTAPLQVGKADALNARTLQLLELAGLFDDIYPQGKTCNTSSTWSNGAFISRQSAWWDELEGCLHKHFLMLGQAHLEQLLDHRLTEANKGVWRSTEVRTIEQQGNGYRLHLSDGSNITTKFLIGADGAHSMVRQHFNIGFDITRPELIWAVIDGIIDTDFPKVPEIIVFQNETSDVAWIPREDPIDRFYIRMDRHDFTQQQVIEKINQALSPHSLKFKHVVWFSQFSVKESVAEEFSINNRAFLVGDACHIHSVNGGQGLNTGLADAFNLIWKIKAVHNSFADESLLASYQTERKPVATGVIETSAKLVRATKYSSTGQHARDYVKLVEHRSGYITGMGIRYGEQGLVGTRVYDFAVLQGDDSTHLYSLLRYNQYTLLTVGKHKLSPITAPYYQHIHITTVKNDSSYWTDDHSYANKALLIRPDSTIAAETELSAYKTLLSHLSATRISA